MPKRSNYFQKLVLMVRTHIADGAIVTESAELTDRVTGEPREVDICIEGTVGGARTIVCIECRAATRKADVTWVEAMTNKHNDLPTNVLILYSRSGFTKAAVDKAKFYNKPIVALRTFLRCPSSYLPWPVVAPLDLALCSERISNPLEMIVTAIE